MDNLHLISVQEQAETDLVASGAHLSVRIAGDAFFTGKEAFRKAKELRDYVDVLKSCGLSEDRVTLADVSTMTSSGLLSKSSSASYRLLVKTSSIDQLGSILAATASQKNAVLLDIEWKYSELESVKMSLLQEASRAAKRAAGAIATALGASIAGVHRASYDFSGVDGPARFPGQTRFGAREKHALTAGDLEMAESMNLSHTSRLSVTVNAEFEVESGGA